MKKGVNGAGFFGVGLAAMILLVAGIACAQSNMVLMVSTPGDWIGQGQTYVTTNQSDIGLSGTPSLVQMSAFGYGMYFTGPGGAPVTVGTYANAARWPFNGSSPGLSISGNGRGCNTLCGNFQVFEIHTNANGNVDRFWASFVQFCECGSTYLTGEVRYASALAPAVPESRTLHVPGEYATIQAALNSASLLAIDTVLVSPGVYNEALNFKGKRIKLLSSSGPSQTSITPPSGGTAVTFSGGETADAMISGFTLTTSGTAIYVASSGPTIVSNNIVNSGTAVNCYFASPIIRSNNIINCSGDAIHLQGAATALVEGNVLRTNGAGVTMFAAGSPIIRNNILQGSRGDAMNMVNQSDADIVQNLIYENTGNGINWLTPSGTRGPRVINNTIARNGSSGIFADGYDANAQIVNNIIIGTPALNVGGFNDSNPPIVRFNDIYSPTGAAYAGLISDLTGFLGNISADPSFACNPSNNFHLLAVSPCVDAGDNDASLVTVTDFDGLARILDGNTNGVAVVDMGAFELNPATAPTPCLYMTCPSNMIVAAAAAQNSAVVNYPAPVAAPVATVSCVPPSGSSFPGGTNTVNCTASYGTNSINCSFTVTVVLPPIITSQPQGTNVLAGQPFSLSVLASGSAPLSYNWSFEGIAIGGALGSTLTISNAQASNEGIYRVVVANSAGSATSSIARVRVLPSPPAIVTNPSSITVSAGSNAAFSVSAIGSGPLSYQWLKEGVALAGATSSQLVVTNAQTTNAGSYQAFVSNSIGSATSAPATLSVVASAPFFVQQPAPVTVSTGATVTLTALARGSVALGYQWRKEGANVAGATQTGLSLSNVTLAATGGYDVVATNAFGAATSVVAQVTVNQTPILQQGLSNQIVDAGSTLLLNVAATGSAVLTYSWQFNGARIATASGASLLLSNVQPAQSGYYRVTVSNQLGTISSTGRVSVFGPPSGVVAWGDNTGGQTNVPAGLNDAVTVAGGDFHSLALRRDGSLIGWGYNGDGQISLPTNATRYVGIAVGSAHNLAIMENGRVISWGRNDSGQTNVPATAVSVAAVAAGDSHSLALLSSGTVVAWGNNAFGQGIALQGLTGVSAIAAGRNHNLALRTNGTITAWGLNNSGQAVAPGGLTGVARIAAGYLHSLALLSNGMVVAWGDNSFGQTNVPIGLSNVVAIAAGDFHSLALRADGSAIGWGDDTYGQIEVPTAVTNAIGIAAGYYHSLALIPSPLLKYFVSSGSLVLQWNGTFVLQGAPTVLGPYLDIAVSGQSYTNSDWSAPSRFFRLRK